MGYRLQIKHLITTTKHYQGRKPKYSIATLASFATLDAARAAIAAGEYPLDAFIQYPKSAFTRSHHGNTANSGHSDAAQATNGT